MQKKKKQRKKKKTLTNGLFSLPPPSLCSFSMFIVAVNII